MAFKTRTRTHTYLSRLPTRVCIPLSFTNGLAPTLLYDVLPQPYYLHFCKLVQAMRIIQQHSIKTVIYHIFIKFISQLYPDVPIPIPTSDYTTSLIIYYSLVLIFICLYDSYLFCSCFQYFRFLATSYILHSSCMSRCFCTICSKLL